MDSTTPEVKSARLKRLQQRLEEMSKQVSLNMVGTIQKVLIEGKSKRSSLELSGRTENFKVVNFAGSKRLIGQIIEVKITESLPNSLRGEIVISE